MLRGGPLAAAMVVLGAGLAAAAEPPDTAAASAFAAARESSTEINKQLTNPIPTTWSLKWKNNVTFLDSDGNGERTQYTLQFQPTLPVVLTPAWKLITRPEFTLIDDRPYTDHQGAARRTTGVGDTVLDLVLAPMAEHWLMGIGPTFIFPTASLDRTGQGKWQAGPAGVAGYLSKRWIASLIAQQWWSLAGSDSRPAVSQLHLQYLASWFFPHGWSVGTSPTIKFDWNATPGNQVTFPLGLLVAKVVKFGGTQPVKFEIQGFYAPVHPNPYGENFEIQILLTPVIPALIPGPVFRR